LSYHEQRELDRLPATIESLEARLAALQEEISAEGFYAQDHEVTGPVLESLADTGKELDQALERWSQLEDRVRLYNASRPGQNPQP
jgi:ATP-binding cassette subfamily F protein uup